MTFASRLAVLTLATLLSSGAAFAQTATPPTKAEVIAAAAADKKQRAAESLECSKQADAKSLKGKERRKFRRECLKTARAGSAAPTAPAAPAAPATK